MAVPELLAPDDQMTVVARSGLPAPYARGSFLVYEQATGSASIFWATKNDEEKYDLVKRARTEEKDLRDLLDELATA